MFNMQDVLKELDWNTGHHFPMANEENQHLEAEINNLVATKGKAKASFEHATFQLEALSKHLKYVLLEAEQNQKLMTAYTQQLDEERHKLRVSQVQKEKVCQEIRLMNKEIKDVEEKAEKKRKDLMGGVVKLEKLKAETQWDLEALSAWEASLKKRDIDNELLKKFSKNDEYKAKEFEVRRQTLQVEVVNRHAQVDKMVAEITNCEQVLQRTGKIFKQQSEERSGLTRRWQDAINNLRQRDDDIRRANTELGMIKEVLAQQEEALGDQVGFLKNECNHNKLIEEEIGKLNTTSCLQRRQIGDLMQENLTLTNEVDVVKRAMYSTSHHLEAERRRRHNFQNERMKLCEEIGKVESEILLAEAKLKQTTDSLLGSSETAKRLEEIIENERKLSNSLVVDKEKVQVVLFRSRKELAQEKDTSRTKEVEISSCEMTTKMLAKRIKQTLDRLMLQKEVVYALDYRINEMEVKIAHLEGQRKDDDATDAINAKIQELEHTLAEHTDVRDFLQAQVVRLEEEMRRLSISISAENDRLLTLRGKLQNQILLSEGGNKQAHAAKLKSQGLQVEENVLSLKVSQLSKSMSKENKSIYDLRKFRLELETSLRQREIEIGTHKEILLAKKKNLDETQGHLKADLKLRGIRIDQFKKKYQLALMTLGKDDDGQQLSITYFKVKSAQEKQLLQEELSDLVEKTGKAEKEIAAGENTLRIINSTNVALKNCVAVIGKDSEENAEMAKLESEILNANLGLRQIKKVFAQKQRHLDGLRSEVEQVNQRRVELGDTLIQHQGQYSVLRKEENSRGEKLIRVTKQMKTLRKNLAQADVEKAERNLGVEFIQDVNKRALFKFQELHSVHEEVSSAIKEYALKNNLAFPQSRSRTSMASKPSSMSFKMSESTHSCVSQVVVTFNT